MKRGFITGPEDKYGNRKTVNLDQISNVAFEEGTDRQGDPKYKIIFNFGYPISIRQNVGQHVPDYVYFVFQDKVDYDIYVDKFTRQIQEEKWIALKPGGIVKRIVNPNFISFISTDPGKNRIITNLACSVSYYNDYQRKTSDFIFFDFATIEEFKSEYDYLLDRLSQPEL